MLVIMKSTSSPRARRIARWAALTLVLLPLVSAPGSAAVPQPRALTCRSVHELMGAYLQHHVEYRTLSEDLRGRVAESYLRRVDPARSLFLESEAEAIRTSLTAVFTDLSQGRCQRLSDLQQVVVERYKEMEQFVRETVSREDYAVDREAELVLDPEKRGFPADRAAREELYRKLIDFQMANYLANDTEEAEAKQKLIHRYELMVLRAEEVDREDVLARFLSSFASALDPHSDYFSSDRYEDFAIHMSLQLEGIGAVLSSRDGYTVVEEVVPGGAADLDGRLRAKDKILSVGQSENELQDVVDMDLRDVVRKIRGRKGSTVWLGVLRQGGSAERFTLALVRDKINLDQQAAKLRFEELEVGATPYKLGVIELPSFYGDKDPTHRQASSDVKRLLREAVEGGAQGIVLDLSRNGGGLLDHAVEITGYFLKRGRVVAVGDSRRRTQFLEDPDRRIHYDGPLVVLTSRVTASAGEILAGAIKDYRRGVIVGDDHTFGKGSVQTVIPLDSGLGALKMTTALFYRPGGSSTQRRGVATDVQLPSLTATADLGEAYQPYALPERAIEAFVPRSGTPDLGFAPIDDASLEVLRTRSAERVGSDERFAEVEELRREAEANQGVVKIADLLEETAPEGLDESEPDTDTNSPQLDEALRILVDLITVERVARNP